MVKESDSFRIYIMPSKHVEITPKLRSVAKEAIASGHTPRDAARLILEYVRDMPWGYSPIYSAMEALDRCLTPLMDASKAVLQISLCRSVGIPARFHVWLVELEKSVVKKINDLLFPDCERQYQNFGFDFYHTAAEVHIGREWLVADATIDTALEPVFEANRWSGVESSKVSSFRYLKDLGSSVDIPPVVFDNMIGGKNLPWYIRPFGRQVMGFRGRRLNRILREIRLANGKL
ncbi:MAG: transglutaminase-like domain-containing protein [bacterium]